MVNSDLVCQGHDVATLTVHAADALQSSSKATASTACPATCGSSAGTQCEVWQHFATLPNGATTGVLIIARLSDDKKHFQSCSATWISQQTECTCTQA